MDKKNVVFIPADEWANHSTQVLEETAKGNLSFPKKEFSRADVVNAFQTAFESVGGVQRLALWAHENYTEFVKLHARLLPSQASSALGETNEIVVKHVIPRSALDE